MKKKSIIISICLIFASILFTILVKNVDVANIGPNDSSVGFSTVNKFFHELIGVHMIFYKLTDILGVIPILMVLGFAIVGLLQVIKRKSILKVDKEVLALGVFYITVLVLYIFFEKVIINYRPTLVDGVLEASYPSSHTLLSLCICGSTIILNNKLFKKIKIAQYENKVALIFMILILVGRIISGVHWFTDIMGGTIISITLLYIFNTTLSYIQERN